MVRPFGIPISSGSASTVTRILHGLRFWYDSFLDDEFGAFDLRRYCLCGEETETSSTTRMVFVGEDGSLTDEGWAAVCASTFLGLINVARGSKELESR